MLNLKRNMFNYFIDRTFDQGFDRIIVFYYLQIIEIANGIYKSNSKD